MLKSEKILGAFFLYTVPLFILIHFLTLGYWQVEYMDSMKRISTSTIQGFPFPSRGQFTGVLFYNSGDESFSLTNAFLNTIITLIASTLLYYSLLRKVKVPKAVKASLISLCYLLGVFSLLRYFGLIGTNYSWFSGYKILSYHVWCL